MSLRVVITHVYSWPEVRRGGERYLHGLAAGLARAGHDVTILTSAAQPGRWVEEGVPVRAVRRRRLWPGRFGDQSDEVAFGLQAAARLAGRRVDVWHALGTADAAMASRLGPARSVYTELGIPFRAYRQGRPDRRLHQTVVDRADAYVCLSAFVADVLRRDFGRSASQVPAGVDLVGFQPRDRRPAPTLLYSGALGEPRKRVGLLLEAAALVRRDVPDLAVWLSGPGDPGPLLDRAPAGVRDAVVVLGTGRPDEQPERYARAWATVLPSESEAFGLSLLESLACGTPVVAATDGGGTTELTGAGYGTLAEPNAVALADACRRALDLAARPETAGACRAEASRFDWSGAVVPAMERLYEGPG